MYMGDLPPSQQHVHDQRARDIRIPIDWLLLGRKEGRWVNYVGMIA